MAVKHQEHGDRLIPGNVPPDGADKNPTFPTFYSAIFSPRGMAFPPHLVPMSTALADDRITKLLVIVGPGAGKALHPMTLIPTPDGPVPIKDLRPGDVVFSLSGSPTTVLGVFPRPASQLWKVTFKDGREIVANWEHLWCVTTKKFLRTARHDTSPPKWRIRTTEEIQFKLSHEKADFHYVPLALPVELPEKSLPIPPYVLGVLIGDGCLRGDSMKITAYDEEIINRVRNEWGHERILYPPSQQPRHCYSVTGIRQALDDLGLWNKLSHEKHIPEEYKSGSVEQRLALIQGLMDTDGTVDRLKKTPSYCTTSEQLAHDVRDVLWSLGCIVHIGEKKGHYTHEGKYIAGRKAYNLSIRAKNTSQLFFLERKKHLASVTQYSDDLKLQITSIEPAEVAESVCIMVDSPDSLYLAGDYIPTHNSNAISIAYPCYLLGCDPSTTVLTFSGSENLPRGFLDASMKIIEHSPHFRRFFPNTKPDKRAGWSTERGMFVTGHHPSDPDASYYAVGLMSKAAVGKHARLIILDDIHTDENSSSPSACEKVVAKYYNTILGRADPRGAKFLLAGRRWSQWDIYGHLMDMGDWVVMRLPAERARSRALWWDVLVPTGMECCWTDPGAAEEIESPSKNHRMFRAYYGEDPTGEGFYWPQMPAKRAEYLAVKRSKPAIAASVYQAQPGGRDSGIFLPEDFREVNLGAGISLSPARLRQLGWPVDDGLIVQAWDTAFETTEHADYSVCVTGFLTPCHSWHGGEDPATVGPPDPHYDVFVVDIMRARMEVGALTRAVREQAERWKPSYIAIERAAAGIGIVQSLSNILPIIGIKVGSIPKAMRLLQAVPGATASVQGWMRQGRVSFWAEHPLFPELRRECLDFSGDGSGYDDQVDALGLLVGQAISLGRGRAILPTESALAGDAAPGSPLSESSHPGMAMLNLFGDLAMAAKQTPSQILDSPAAQTRLCLNCKHWIRPSRMCSIHGRQTAGFDSCEHWTAQSQTGNR